MNSEENDPVWDLLSKMRETEVDPLFSRNVTREVRLLPEEKTGIIQVLKGLLQPQFLVPAGALGALILTTVAVLKGGADSEAARTGGAGEIALSQPEDTGELTSGTEVAVADTVEGNIESSPAIDEIEEAAQLYEIASIQDVAVLSDDHIAALLY